MNISISIINCLKDLKETLVKIEEKYNLPKYKCTAKLSPITELTSDWIEGTGFAEVHSSYNQLCVRVDPGERNGKSELDAWPMVKDDLGYDVRLKVDCCINPIDEVNIKMIDHYLWSTFLAPVSATIS